jgi:hypothetical protein
MCKTYTTNPLAPAMTATDAGRDLAHGRVDMAILSGSRRELTLAEFVLKLSGLVSTTWLGDTYLVCTLIN